MLNLLHAAIILGASSSMAYFGWQVFGPDLSSPRIVLAPAAVDFGEAKPGDEVSVQFNVTNRVNVTNRGWSPLAIEGFQTSCTCSVATVAKTELSPGESTPVTVTIRIDSDSGEIRQAVQVSSNDPRNPEVMFAATGRVAESTGPSSTPSRNKAMSRR